MNNQGNTPNSLTNNKSNKNTKPEQKKRISIWETLLYCIITVALHITLYRSYDTTVLGSVLNLILAVLAAIPAAKAMAGNDSLFPILSYLPAVVLALISTTDIGPLFTLLASAAVSVILYKSLKKKFSKATTCVAVSFTLVLTLTVSLLCDINAVGGEISVSGLRKYLEAAVTEAEKLVLLYKESVNSLIAELPESIQGTYKESYEQIFELLSDTHAMVTSFALFVPALAIVVSNIISYLGVCVHYFFTKNENAPVNSLGIDRELKISVMGTSFFTVAFLIFAFFGMGSIIGLIATSVMLIYTPGLALIGIKAMISKKLRLNTFAVIILVATVIFSPIWAVFLLAFWGGISIFNDYIASKVDSMGKKQ